MQVENEYGNVLQYHGIDGLKYFNWCSAFAESLDAGVPFIMCQGATGSTISTINGFYAFENLNSNWKKHPNDPGMWTENWDGWYTDIGYQRTARSAADSAYSTAR